MKKSHPPIFCVSSCSLLFVVVVVVVVLTNQVSSACDYYASPVNITTVMDIVNENTNSFDVVCLIPGIYEGMVKVNNSKSSLTIAGTNKTAVVLQNITFSTIYDIGNRRFSLDITEVSATSFSVPSPIYQIYIYEVSVTTTDEFHIFNIEANRIVFQHIHVVNGKMPTFNFIVPTYEDDNSLWIDGVLWEGNIGNGGMAYMGYFHSIRFTDCVFANNILIQDTAKPFFWGEPMGKEVTSLNLRNITLINNLWYNSGLFSFTHGEVVIAVELNISCNPFTNTTSLPTNTTQYTYYPPFYGTNTSSIVVHEVTIPTKCPLTCITPGLSVTSSVFQCVECPVAMVSYDYGPCVKCASGTFSRNNQQCTRCPEYAEQSSDGMTSCYCKWGGFNVDDTNEMACSNVVFAIVVGFLVVPGMVFVAVLWKVWHDNPPSNYIQLS